MPHVLFLGFILSLLVIYWPGAEPPAAVKTWLGRLWIAFATALLAGMVSAYFNVTTTTFPSGSYKISYSAPAPVIYLNLAAATAVGLLSLLGAAFILRGESRQFAAALNLGGEDAARAKARLWTMGMAALAAAGAFAVSWLFSGPLTYTSADGYSNILPFMVGMLTFGGFISALAWLWSSARLGPVSAAK